MVKAVPFHPRVPVLCLDMNNAYHLWPFSYIFICLQWQHYQHKELGAGLSWVKVCE